MGTHASILRPALISVLLGTLTAVSPASAAMVTGHEGRIIRHSDPQRPILSRTVPQGFIGVDMDPWEIKRRGLEISAELDRAAATGIETIRFPLYWFDIQPYASDERVPYGLRSRFTPDPDGGAPFNWTNLDEFVAAAAARGISLMPVLLGSPTWAADSRFGGRLKFPIPRDPNQFASFTRSLAQRYGSRGSFWTANSSLARVPITRWQVWNEPDLSIYWPQHADEAQTVRIGRSTRTSRTLGFAPTYLELLRPTRARILEADPDATIVLASVTNLSTVSLRKIYASGGKGLFDAVAANIFTRTPAKVVTAIRSIRSLMAANGNGNLPYYVTEYSWSSGRGRLPITVPLNFMLTSQAGQASNSIAALSAFVANRSSLKIAGAFWHNWIGPDSGATVWDFSGMRKYGNSTGIDKSIVSAFSAYALGLQGCTAKTSAVACLR